MENDLDDDDEFFGNQDDDDDNVYYQDYDSTTRTGYNDNGELAIRDHLAKEHELETIGYLEQYDNEKETRLQDGFEQGYHDTFDVAVRIGELLGQVVAQSKIISSSSPQQEQEKQNNQQQHQQEDHDGSTDCDDDNNTADAIKQNESSSLEATRLVRDVLTKFQNSDTSNGGGDLQELEDLEYQLKEKSQK